MRLNLLASLIGALWAGQATAAQVSSHSCRISGSQATCEIRLEGRVGEHELLFLSHVHDRDELSYGARELGSTGNFLGRTFHAGFFPRVYSLKEIAGAESPVLTLRAEGGLIHRAGIPRSAKVKVIDQTYPLRKIIGPAVLHVVSFGLLCLLCAFVLGGLRERTYDGWLYPRDELRWFAGSLAAYLVLRHEVAEMLVPLIWSAAAHLFTQRIAVFSMLWTLTLLLLNGRFSDRSCIERSPPRSQIKSYARLADTAFITSLILLACFPNLSEREATSLLALPLLPLVYAIGKAIQGMEWQRVLKRSSKSPFAFQISLFLLGFGALGSVMRTLLGLGAGAQFLLETSAWACLIGCVFRARGASLSREKSSRLARECRAVLIRHAHGSARLQALCDFVEDEWGAARISVISVDEDAGLVLASSGPDAIPPEQRAESRRLGPFLRRVCKQGQMLYAPVAEELGQDLQSQGLKHSSLAIPLAQENKVRAVLCMMADEGERIPPNDAGQLEQLVEALSLEILSAVAQHVAEDKNHHLLSIARRADALAVEQLDHWGHFHQAKDSDSRVVLGGDCVPAGPFLEQLRKSPTFGKLWGAYRAELRGLWTAIAASYEFIPKDNREDFWVISPREFRNPLFRELGPERVAVLLASALERHARAISSKETYHPLGFCGVRLVTSLMHLRPSSWHGSAVEIDSDEFTLLLDLRQRCLPGTVIFHGNAATLEARSESGFSCRFRVWAPGQNERFLSILQTTADKKEIRKIESQALEKARVQARKAA